MIGLLTGEFFWGIPGDKKADCMCCSALYPS